MGGLGGYSPYGCPSNTAYPFVAPRHSFASSTPMLYATPWLAHPAKVVLSEVQYTHANSALKLLESLPNLSIEISRFVGTDGIADLLKTAGPHRVLFGSRFSRVLNGRAIVLPAQLRTRRTDARGDLLGQPGATPRRELVWIRQSSTSTTTSGALASGAWMTDQTRFLRIMDAAGVDLACVFCIWHGDHRYGNDITARFVAKNPSRFIGAGYVNPRYPDEAIQECERAIDELGMRFIKLYPSYVGRSIDDAVFEPVLGWANDRGLVVMSHHNNWPEAEALYGRSRTFPPGEVGHGARRKRYPCSG